jgi:hypothetical protein
MFVTQCDRCYSLLFHDPVFLYLLFWFRNVRLNAKYLAKGSP